MNTGAECISTINVMDFQSLDPFNVSAMRSWPLTPAGIEAATECFQRWIRDIESSEDPYTQEQMSEFIDNGVCAIGDGAIVLVRAHA